MNIQEQLNSLIRGNPLSVDTYLREVCKNEHISDTKASMHIYMLKLDGNNRPRTCDFCDYLINRILFVILMTPCSASACTVFLFSYFTERRKTHESRSYSVSRVPGMFYVPGS